jgi:hypothetical protein
MNERAAILAALTASASWTTLVLAANTKWEESWGRNGLEPSTAPFDVATGKLTACAALTLSTRSPANLTHFGERAFFRLWVYHDYDFNAVQAALWAARRLLDNTYITADNRGTPLLRWVDDMPEFRADELSGAAGGSSRYVMLQGWH